MCYFLLNLIVLLNLSFSFLSHANCILLSSFLSVHRLTINSVNHKLVVQSYRQVRLFVGYIIIRTIQQMGCIQLFSIIPIHINPIHFGFGRLCITFGMAPPTTAVCVVLFTLTSINTLKRLQHCEQGKRSNTVLGLGTFTH